MCVKEWAVPASQGIQEIFKNHEDFVVAAVMV
jgi:hypothetical protein